MPGWSCRFMAKLVRSAISVSVSAIVGGACGAVRLSIVNQKTRQLMMQKTAMRLASRSAVRSLDSSALQPDLRILWKTSIFQRMAYQSIFSIAASRAHRQVRDQFPIDLLAALGRSAFAGVDDRQLKRG